MKSNWRIAELQAAVEFALEAAGYAGQESARIRSVPDTRAIRYYTTLGILDRPAEMKGRTAYYGRRHLLQLVAIKRLQSEGLKLGEIQQKLTGLTDRKLGGIAKLPKGYWGSLERKLEQKAKQQSAQAKPRKLLKDLRQDTSSAIAAEGAAAQAGVTTGSPVVAALATASVEQIRKRADGRDDRDDGLPKKSKKSSQKRGRIAEAFWANPVQAADQIGVSSEEAGEAPQIDPNQIIVRNETRIDFPGGIAISVSIPAHEVTPEIIEELLPQVQQLASSVRSIQQRRKS